MMQNFAMLLKSAISEVAATVKLPVGVAASTTTVGVVQMFSLIPDDIGKLAALIGAGLSFMLIVKVSIEVVMLIRKFKAGKAEDDKDVD